MFMQLFQQDREKFGFNVCESGVMKEPCSGLSVARFFCFSEHYRIIQGGIGVWRRRN